jgi:hypothetical protein
MNIVSRRFGVKQDILCFPGFEPTFLQPISRPTQLSQHLPQSLTFLKARPLVLYGIPMRLCHTALVECDRGESLCLVGLTVSHPGLSNQHYLSHQLGGSSFVKRQLLRTKEVYGNVWIVGARCSVVVKALCY